MDSEVSQVRQFRGSNDQQGLAGTFYESKLLVVEGNVLSEFNLLKIITIVYARTSLWYVGSLAR